MLLLRWLLIYKVGFGTGLPTNSYLWWNHQSSMSRLTLKRVWTRYNRLCTFWCFCCTSYFPQDNGEHVAGHAPCQTIKDAPQLRNASQLYSFIRLVNYWFSQCTFLYTVCCREKWWLGFSSENSIDKPKSQPTSERLLVHYDMSKELLLSREPLSMA